MPKAVQEARRFQDLLNSDVDGPYLFRNIFSDEGWLERRRSKKTFKLLKKIDVALRAVLRDGEQVFFLTHGTTSLSFVEWYFLGFVLYYMNRRAIVLTNQRILLLQINSRWKPRHFRSQIRWENVAELRTTALGNTKVEFHSGSKIMFTGVPRSDRKWLANVMNEVIHNLDASDQAEVEQLCPRCFDVVDGRPVACPHCASPLKSAKTARLLSLVFPGAGDMYLGHRGFALLEVSVGVVLWLGVVGIAVDPSVGLGTAFALAGVVVLVVHGVDALTTYHIGCKGLLPEYGTSNRWRFALAAALPAISLFTLLVAVPTKVRLRPEPMAVAGEQFSTHQLRALRNAGYLGPAETVRYFYSNGTASVLQDGNLFTDDRIVSYELLVDTTFHESARFDEVVDLHVAPADPGESFSSIYVVKDNGAVFYLIVSPLGGGDSTFADALFDRWRSVRMASPEGGVWFDGGDGSSLDDAILVRGLEPEHSREAVEGWWLRVWLGEQGTDWQTVKRTEAIDEGRTFDVITVQDAAGDRSQLFFEVAGDP